MLKKLGDSVITFDAGSTPEALKILHKEKIDLMFLDLDLGKFRESNKAEESGLEIVRQLKNRNIDMPSITVLSVNVNQSAIMEAYNLGIEDFISKPPSSHKYY